MKRFFACILVLICFSFLGAQEESASLDWDINTIFDEMPAEETGDETAGSAAATPPAVSTPPAASKPPAASTPAKAPASAPVQLKKRGITFNAAFQFVGSIAPGYNDAPWFQEDDDEFSWEQKVKMRTDFTTDAQISETFRVKNVLYFEVPGFSLKLGDFFFDYTLYDTVFIRAGKFSQAWGISPNFQFTNLLARIPGDDYQKQYQYFYKGDSYLARADVPIGIGGIQLLAITRANLLRSNAEMPGWRHLGYGAKYNLAFRWADFDLGFLYHDYMPFRGFLSIKTTLGNTELYNEWLAVDFLKPDDFSGAANIGFVHEFFDRKLRINGEFFYNAEKGAEWYRSETVIMDATTSPFIEGPNFALNLLYRFGGKGNPRIFIQSLYGAWEDTARITPGLRLTPWPNIELYVAFPLNLGVQTGYYYVDPEETNDRRHFKLVTLLTIKGSVRAAYNY